MGLFNKALMNRGISRAMQLLNSIPPPKALTDEEWLAIRNNLKGGYGDLVTEVNRGSTSANWEHGGVVSPIDGPRTSTSMSENSINFPFLPNGERYTRLKGFSYHTHPGHLFDNDTGTPLVAGNLSVTDLLSPLRGVSALDTHGGFGYAINNPAAPEFNDILWQDIRQAATKAASKHLPGKEWTLQRSVPLGWAGDSLPYPHEDSLPISRGLGQAMKNTGVLEQYGRIPGTRAAARGESFFDKSAEAATKAAEQIIREVLRGKGYKGGQVEAIIASLTASGSLLAVASSIANREEVDATPV